MFWAVSTDIFIHMQAVQEAMCHGWSWVGRFPVVQMDRGEEGLSSFLGCVFCGVSTFRGPPPVVVVCVPFRFIWGCGGPFFVCRMVLGGGGRLGSSVASCGLFRVFHL